MSLPPTFTTPEEYFQYSLQFFKKYQHLYKTANTDILSQNILDQIDVTNLDSLNIFEQNFDLETVKDNNSFLDDFFERLNKLKVNYQEFDENRLLQSDVNVPLSQKKKHEIVNLTKEIKTLCERSKCDVVVDFGSGLGYLDQLINNTTNLKVLGIEGSESHYVNAKKRQNKYHKDSVQDVKYIKHMINENSDRNIQDYVAEKFGKGNFCVAGLHACADLTIDGVSLFLKLEDAKALILMPCCYHKMAADEGRFKNFPLSSCLKQIFEENNGYEYMKVPFLRLGAQPPSREEDLEDLVFNLLARATLQLYADRRGCKLKRNKRKAVRTKKVHKDFSEYVQNATVGFTLTNENNLPENSNQNEIESLYDKVELQNIWRETQKFKLRAAIFVLLQRYLQPVIENFILYDRLVFLMENGMKNSYFKKIFSETISPRCLALISLK